MQYPFSVGDLNILGILDSGADYLLVDPEIWGQLEGEKVSEPIGYLGVSGVWQQIESAKMVVFRVEDGQTSWLAYPLPNQKLGIKALESRSGKTNSRSKQNSRLASKNFIKKKVGTNLPASNTHSDPEPQRPDQTPMRTLCPKPAKDPTTKPPLMNTPPPPILPPPNFTQKNPDKKPLVVCHLPPRNHPMPFLTKPPPPPTYSQP